MHVIRLRGNWSLNAFAQPEGEPTRVDEPGQWLSHLGADFRGRVRLTRRFHAPTGITANDIVAVTFEHQGVVGSVLLDGIPLAAFDSLAAPQPILFSHDIRGQLERGHELALEIERPDQLDLESPQGRSEPAFASPVMGTVRLEIRSA